MVILLFFFATLRCFITVMLRWKLILLIIRHVIHFLVVRCLTRVESSLCCDNKYLIVQRFFSFFFLIDFTHLSLTQCLVCFFFFNQGNLHCSHFSFIFVVIFFYVLLFSNLVWNQIMYLLILCAFVWFIFICVCW